MAAGTPPSWPASAASVDRGVLAAGALLTAATGFGAAVSVREGVRGEPLGVRVPGAVRTHLLLGWGSGVSAPWPMPAAVLLAALRAGPAAAGSTSALVGAALVAGTAVEPVTWRRGVRAPGVRAALALNLLSAAALLAAGRRARSRAAAAA